MTLELATKRTTGVEIECFLPGSNDPFTPATQALESVGVPVRSSGSHLTTNTNEWLVKHDGTVHDGNGMGGCEINSPIMRTPADIELVAVATQALADHGFEVNPSCGLHVHIGVGDSVLEPEYGIDYLPYVRGDNTLRRNLREQSQEIQDAVLAADLREAETVRTLPTLWLVHERVMDAMMTPSRRKNSAGYAKSLALAGGQPYWSPEFVDEKMRGLANLEFTEQSMRDYLYEPLALQYHSGNVNQVLGAGRAKVNFGAIRKHSTVEFRHMGGTLNGKLITHWVRLLHEVFRWASDNPGHSPAIRWYSGMDAVTAFWREIGNVSLDQRNYWKSRIRALGYLTTPQHLS